MASSGPALATLPPRTGGPDVPSHVLAHSVPKEERWAAVPLAVQPFCLGLTVDPQLRHEAHCHAALVVDVVNGAAGGLWLLPVADVDALHVAVCSGDVLHPLVHPPNASCQSDLLLVGHPTNPQVQALDCLAFRLGARAAGVPFRWSML